MATERSLERCGVDAFDLLLLHNPDRTGYTQRGGLGRAGGGARRRADRARSASRPGPANGFTLDLIDCFERFGERIDWAMVILNPLEPWPGELVLPAAERHGVELITRVVDYGGLFHDDVLPGHPFPQWDHRTFRPDGWIERGRERLERMRPIAERHGLTTLQLACAWNLAHEPVRCVAPTLIQEPGAGARPIEDKRAELAAVAGAAAARAPTEVAEIRAIGDNTGSMALKGAARRLRRRARGRPLAARPTTSRRSPGAGASTPRATSSRGGRPGARPAWLPVAAGWPTGPARPPARTSRGRRTPAAARSRRPGPATS